MKSFKIAKNKEVLEGGFKKYARYYFFGTLFSIVLMAVLFLGLGNDVSDVILKVFFYIEGLALLGGLIFAVVHRKEIHSFGLALNYVFSLIFTFIFFSLCAGALVFISTDWICCGDSVPPPSPPILEDLIEDNTSANN